MTDHSLEAADALQTGDKRWWKELGWKIC